MALPFPSGCPYVVYPDHIQEHGLLLFLWKIFELEFLSVLFIVWNKTEWSAGVKSGKPGLPIRSLIIYRGAQNGNEHLSSWLRKYAPGLFREG